MKISSLTAAEEALMKVIWSLEEAFMKDITTAYPEPKPHQNTISTYLKILTKKGFIKAKKIGRINKYSVAIHYDTYKQELIKGLITDHFDGFATELFQFSLNNNIFSSEDVQKSLSSSPNGIQMDETEKISEYLENLISKTSKKDKKKKKKKKKKK